MGRVLFVFLDGVGIGPLDSQINPFFQAQLPNLRALLGGQLPHLQVPEIHTGEAIAFPLDPLLGVEGLPQSGTGHTALMTGENAPALYGRHFGPWVPVKLRPLVKDRNFLTRAMAEGYQCTFANAYPKEFRDSRWARRPAGPALAAEAAGLLTRQAESLAKGEAVSSEIVNSGWKRRLGYTDLPDITPEEAGRNLGRISSEVDLTFFAHYGTDYAGHRGKMPGGALALERVDAFLGGILGSLPEASTLIVASDHGNLEDITGGHTLNPVFCLLKGPLSPQLREGRTRITDLPGLILDALSLDSAATTT